MIELVVYGWLMATLIMACYIGIAILYAAYFFVRA